MVFPTVCSRTINANCQVLQHGSDILVHVDSSCRTDVKPSISPQTTDTARRVHRSYPSLHELYTVLCCAFNRDVVACSLSSHFLAQCLARSLYISSRIAQPVRKLSFWHIWILDPLLGTRVLEIVLHLVENLGISCGYMSCCCLNRNLLNMAIQWKSLETIIVPAYGKSWRHLARKIVDPRSVPKGQQRNVKVEVIPSPSTVHNGDPSLPKLIYPISSFQSS